LLVVTKYLNAELGDLVALKCEATLKVLDPPTKMAVSGMGDTRFGPPNAGTAGNARADGCCENNFNSLTETWDMMFAFGMYNL
jgi:hypothetical protein